MRTALVCLLSNLSILESIIIKLEKTFQTFLNSLIYNLFRWLGGEVDGGNAQESVTRGIQRQACQPFFHGVDTIDNFFF